jgi:hypothetical protein
MRSSLEGKALVAMCAVPCLLLDPGGGSPPRSAHRRGPRPQPTHRAPRRRAGEKSMRDSTRRRDRRRLLPPSFLAGLSCLFLVGASRPARGAAPPPPPSPCVRPVPDPKAVPPILDPRYRHQKRHQLELSPHGGSLLGRTIGSTFLAGVRARFHLGSMLSLGASYEVTRLQSTAAFEVPPARRDLHFLLAEASLSNDLAMRLSSKLIALDLFLTVGLGATSLGGSWNVAGLVGGGVKFYTGLPWLAIRIDLSTLIHPTELGPSSSRVDADLALTGGLSFFLPARHSTFE